MRLGLSARPCFALATSLVLALPCFTGCDGGSAPPTGAMVKDAPLPADQQKSFDENYNRKTGKGSTAGNATKGAPAEPSTKK